MLNQAQTVAVSVTVIMGVLAIVAVGLRLYCRLSQKRSLALDDYLIIVALFISTGVAILTDYVACTNDIGDPKHELSYDDVVLILKMNLALENFQILGLCLVKVALLYFYRRIFFTQPYVAIADVLMGIASAFALAIILTNIFDKWPVSKQWDPTAPFTVDVSALLIAFVSGNAVLDFLTLSLPIAGIWNLHMDRGRKLVMGVMFSIGSSAVVVTFLRLHFAVEYTKKVPTGNSFIEVPFIYNVLMALIELPLFIIVTCAVAFGPLFRGKFGVKSFFRSLRSYLWSTKSSKQETLKDTNGPRHQVNLQSSEASKRSGGKDIVEVRHELHQEVTQEIV